jgi:hypothetical protein
MSLEGLTDGLRFLVARGAAPSFDALVSDLSSIRLPGHLIAWLANLIDNLPLPETMPPSQVKGARRLDSAPQIRQFAKLWQNCLDNHVVQVNDGQAAVYFWPDTDSPALCMLLRHGRLGWALDDVKGPKNAELPTARRQEIYDAFASIGIPRGSAIRAIAQAAEWEERLRVGRPRRQAGDDSDGTYQEFEVA